MKSKLFLITFCLLSLTGTTVFFLIRKKKELVPEFNFDVRFSDKFGSGKYEASRSGGKRKHKGLDLICGSNQDIKMPMSGVIKRFGIVYKDTKKYNLIEIENPYFKVKIMYVSLKENIYLDKFYKKGTIIGKTQDITKRYKGITPHIHVEVYRNNENINPNEFLV